MRFFITGEQVVTASLIRGVVLYMADGVLKYKSKNPVSKEGLSWIKRYKKEVINALSPNNILRLEREIKRGLTDEDITKAGGRFKGLLEIEDVVYRGLRAWSDVISLDFEVPWPEE